MRKAKSGFTPNGNKLLVCEVNDGDSSANGVVIPGKVGVGPHVYKVEVEEAGPAAKSYKRGDQVIIPIAGYELHLAGRSFRVVSEEEVLGLVEEKSLIEV